MKTKTTLILLALVVAIACWIKFYESKRPNTEEANRRAGNIVNIEPEKVEGIVIQNGDDKIELRKIDGKWRLQSPINDQADSPVIESFLTDLENWEKDETISEKEIEADKSRLTEYDLVKPKFRVKLEGKEMPPAILFGKDAALENRMYVRFENSKDTFLVRNTVKNDIAKKAEEFRDRKLTDLTSAQVTRAVLKTPAGEMELQKQGDFWEIVKPLHARGDSQKIGDLIAQITSARIEQFVADDRGDLQPYGLAQPRGSIALFKEGDKEGRVLQIGAVPEKENNQVYVRFSARNFVYTLPKKIEEILKFTPSDLRDRHLVRIDPNNLDRLTIEGTAGKTVLSRKDQTWVITNKNDQPANNGEVNRLFEMLGKEEVTKFVEDVASDLPKYGLDKPQLQLTFSSVASGNTAESNAGEHPFATVAFGKVEGDNVFARVGEEPFIVAVRRTLLDSIFADPAQWQALAIFKFKPEEVHRLEIATEKRAVLTRGANQEWTGVEGSEPFNQANVQSLVNTLVKLRAVRWIGGAPPPQAFDKPQITIAFTASPDDKAAHKLTVGGPAGEGMWYARAEGRDGIFVLSNPDFNILRQPLSEAVAPAPAATPPAVSASPTPVLSPTAKR